MGRTAEFAAGSWIVRQPPRHISKSFLFEAGQGRTTDKTKVIRHDWTLINAEKNT